MSLETCNLVGGGNSSAELFSCFEKTSCNPDQNAASSIYPLKYESLRFTLIIFGYYELILSTLILVISCLQVAFRPRKVLDLDFELRKERTCLTGASKIYSICNVFMVLISFLWAILVFVFYYLDENSSVTIGLKFKLLQVIVGISLALCSIGILYALQLPFIMALNPKYLRKMKIVLFNLVINAMFLVYFLTIVYFIPFILICTFLWFYAFGKCGQSTGL
ncbi:Oidioi.mRNA.OKI2018_I69.chr1.g408.t2.cds [Oikopleura dioica]|uniref:Oidioi.mRNA.OKI2018_I69.chr1.g408.t2.cds n=1 Tax=Oikopleura dioica TaxID=34765 RepID=A0ABN7SJQ6_OIKDI|nr:Oidioi.mRNA.OKI2018_I69.chr1.g408.t2.cds [Oikopleura dioica]